MLSPANNLIQHQRFLVNRSIPQTFKDDAESLNGSQSQIGRKKVMMLAQACLKYQNAPVVEYAHMPLAPKPAQGDQGMWTLINRPRPPYSPASSSMLTVTLTE